MTWSYSSGVLTSSGGTSSSPDLLSTGVAAVQSADSTKGYVNGYESWLNNVEVRAGNSFISIDPDLQLELRGSSFINPQNGGVRHDYRSTLILNTSGRYYDTSLDFKTGATFECRLLYPNDPPPKIIYRNSARLDYPNIQAGSTPTSVNIQALDLYNVSVTNDFSGTFLKLYFGLASSASISKLRIFTNVNTNLKPQYYSTTYNDSYIESLGFPSEAITNTVILNRPTFYLGSSAPFSDTNRAAQITLNNPTFLNSCWNQTVSFNGTGFSSNDPTAASKFSIFYTFQHTFKSGLAALQNVVVRYVRAVQSSQNSPSWSAPPNSTISTTSNSSGTFTAVSLLDAYREGTSLNALERYNWTAKARLYNYKTPSDAIFTTRVFYQGTTNLSQGYSEEVQMLAVAYLTLTQSQAAALTGIAFVASGTTSGTVTLTANHTVAELWQYYRQWISTLANFDSVDSWTYDGATLNVGAWNLTINGCTLTGNISVAGTLTLDATGLLSSTASQFAGTSTIVVGSNQNFTGDTFANGATINRSGAGSYTVTVSSTTGITAGTGVTLQTPQFTLTLTNLQAGSVVYLLNANHQSLEAATASGTSYTFTSSIVNGTSYYYGVQKPGYLPVENPVTGSTASLSLTVIQQVDSFYNAAYTSLTGVTITDNGASPVSYGSKSFGVTVNAGGNSPVQLYSYLSYQFASTGTYQGKAAYLWRRMINTIDGVNFETARGDYYSSGGALTYKGVQITNYDASSSTTVLDEMQADDASYLTFCKFVLSGLQSGTNVGLISGGSVAQSVTASGSTLVLTPFYFTGSPAYTIAAGLYGYLKAFVATSAQQGIVLVPIAQVVDAFKVSSSPSSITAFTFNDGTSTITQSANASIQDLYDASQYRYSQLAQIGLTPPVSSTDGVTRSLTYNFTLSSATLSGSGTLSLPTKTFTLSGTGYTSLPVIDSTGLRFRLYGLPTASGANPVMRVKDTTTNAITNPTITNGEAYFTVVLGRDYQLRCDAVGYAASNFFTINSNSASSYQISLQQYVDNNGTPIYGQGTAAIKSLITFNPSTLYITIAYSSSYPNIDLYSAFDRIEELLATTTAIEFTAHPIYSNGTILFPRDIVSNAANPARIQAASGNTGIPTLTFQVVDQANATPYNLFDFSNGKTINYPTTVNVAQGGSGGSSLTQQQVRDALELASTGGKTPISNQIAAIPTTDYSAAIAAIKAKTDQFAFSTANRVDATAIAVSDKSGYSLTQSFPVNFASLSITAGGAVTAGTVSDKSGYSLTQAFPANFSSLAISIGGMVTAGTVNDKSGYSLSTTGIDSIWRYSVNLVTGGVGGSLLLNTGNASNQSNTLVGLLTPTRAANLDYLDAAISGINKPYVDVN